MKNSFIKYLNTKRIEKLDDKVLDKAIKKGNVILKRNIRQYEKPQKQFGGQAPKETYNVNYNDMLQVSGMPETTDEERRTKLQAIRRLMRRDTWTPSQAKKKEREFFGHTRGGTESPYSQFFNEDDFSQAEKAEIIEQGRSIFGAFTAEEIAKIGSEEIVNLFYKFYEKESGDWNTITKKTKRAIRYRLKKAGMNTTRRKTKSPYGLAK